MSIHLFQARIEKYGGEILNLDVYASSRESAIESIKEKLDFDYISLEVEKKPLFEVQDGYFVVKGTTRY